MLKGTKFVNFRCCCFQSSLRFFVVILKAYPPALLGKRTMPATRGQGKPQSTSPILTYRLIWIGDRPREASQNVSNRNTAPATSTTPQTQSRSGTSTPDNLSGQSTTAGASSSIIPNEVKEYMHSSIYPWTSPMEIGD